MDLKKLASKVKAFVVSSTLALTLISCGANIDSSGWLTNLDDAKKAAQDENKKIFLFFSEDEGDGKSLELKERIFNTEDFTKAYTEKYVLVNIDYSNSRFTSDQKNLQRDLKYYELFRVPVTPYFLILSSEGYVISPIGVETSDDLDSLRLSFAALEGKISEFDANLAKIRSGSKEEKLEAINKILDSTSPEHIYHLSPLNKLYISLDKTNETEGYIGNLISFTYAKAEDYFLEDEYEKACEEFAKLAKNKHISDEDKQMALFTAGKLLADSGSDNLEKIRSYLQQAYDIAPETEAAQSIKLAINYVQTKIDGEGDEAPEVEEATAAN